MDLAQTKLWLTMSFRNADLMIDWLSAVGFVEHEIYRDEDDASVVHHAEYVWPEGGGVMFGTERPDGGVHNAGHSAAYLVVEDPDVVFQRAVEAGATVVRAVVDQDYGGRGGTVTDPEGNQWSFGNYQPA